ncbi:MAG: class A beta-lactamase [Muribaculaceae bacterium]|nr:class A beta-lactamase [Muribaculaceae bacterium]
MKRTVKEHMIRHCIVAMICLTMFQITSSCKTAGRTTAAYDRQELADTIGRIVSEYPGEIGVAVIIDNTDTVTVNDKNIYPMMSVFKLHQALAVCDRFCRERLSLDSVMIIDRDRLDAGTWSPMLKEHPEQEISLTVKELMRYSLSLSDNNASNVLFRELVGITATDSLVATLIPRSSFRIAYTEEEMSADHDRAYANSTSPLGAAILMNRLFTDSLTDSDMQSFVKVTLMECRTGADRIAAPLLDKEGTSIAHKTGSGYTNEKGELVAHNDVAYVRLPDNRCYTLAVFVKDFKGDETEASKAIARISAAVYSMIEKNVR